MKVFFAGTEIVGFEKDFKEYCDLKEHCIKNCSLPKEQAAKLFDLIYCMLKSPEYFKKQKASS